MWNIGLTQVFYRKNFTSRFDGLMELVKVSIFTFNFDSFFLTLIVAALLALSEVDDAHQK